MYIDTMSTSLGNLIIEASTVGVTQVKFTQSGELTLDLVELDSKTPSDITEECKQQLQAYFSGSLRNFELPLDLKGTLFQQSVWEALLTISFGQTASYLDIATMIDNPKAVRAVGAANGKNPVGIIVPCHRVIGSNQTLTGYAGGLDRKAWLLKHEGFDINSHKTGKNSQVDLFDAF